MNTMEFNKIFGAATAALLIFLLAGFVSRSVYSIPEPARPGFAVELAQDEAAPAAAPGEEDFATLLASVNPADGAGVFRRCSACHKIEDGANGVGPHLYGVVGRDVGAVQGFRYSGALNAAAEVWDFDALNGFLTNPRGYAAGTSMGFAGLSNPRERAQVIAYLNAQGPAPLPLPEPAAAEAAASETDESAAEAAPAEEAAAEEAAAEEIAAAEPVAEEAAAEEPVADAPVAAEAVAEDAATAEAAAEAEAAPADPLAVALAAADAARGGEIYANCALCHTLDEGRHGIAPSLHGVIGREVASVARFPYSQALTAAGGVWTVERLDAYLAAPAEFGSHSGVPALGDGQARADVLAHLNTAVEGAPALAPSMQEASAAGEAAEASVAVETPTEAAPAAEHAEAAPAEAAPAQTTAEAPAETPAAPAEPAAEGPAEAETEVAAVAPDAAPAAEAAPEAPAAAAGSDDPFVVAYLAAASADGQRQFRKCSACHRLEEGRNGVGPSLWNVVGRDIASVGGFNYSDALKGKEGAWSFEQLNAFLENPKGWAPGTKMAFAGLKKLEERAAVIRYLNESGDKPLDIQ